MRSSWSQTNDVGDVLVGWGLFFVRALLMEKTESTATGLQKDLLWGLCVGGVVTIVLRGL